LYLAAAGIGHLSVYDDDTVSLTNLHRQILYTEDDIGDSKSVAAAEALKQRNSTIQISAHAERLTHHTILDALRKVDIVLDATDTFPAKYLLNAACRKMGIPLVYGSVLGWTAEVCTFLPTPDSPCYACLYSSAPEGKHPSCRDAGVVGMVAGMAGSLQALAAVRHLLGVSALGGHWWRFDGRTMTTHTLRIPPAPDCPVCRVSANVISLPSIDTLPCSSLLPWISWPAIEALGDDAVRLDVSGITNAATSVFPGSSPLAWPDILTGKELDWLLQQQNKAFILFCPQGERSQIAGQILQELGCPRVYRYRG
jgi:molybdopterin/thiamine biosynthesis adenylyltransferase